MPARARTFAGAVGVAARYPWDAGRQDCGATLFQTYKG